MLNISEKVSVNNAEYTLTRLLGREKAATPILQRAKTVSSS